MKLWRVTGPGLFDLVVEASCLDEALKFARALDERYDQAQVAGEVRE